MLYHNIEPGIHYQTLKALLPELSGLRSDSRRDLTEAFLPMEILGYQAEKNYEVRRLTRSADDA